MNEAALAAPAPITQATSRAPVLMPALVEGAFDYLVPEGTAQGALVEAKLAGRSLVGAVWEADVDAKDIPLAKLKPVTRVLDLPPLQKPFRQWLDWISDFTLAPKGAVLSLCGLAHAAKAPKKSYAATVFNITLPSLTSSQQIVADSLIEAVQQGHPSPFRGEDGWGPIQGKTSPLETTLRYAKELRKELPDAEKFLWQELRRENLGTKFRKQHPIGPYIADFASLEARLIIELDGGQHNDDAAKKKDAARTAFLEAQGFEILRFWNSEMLQQKDAVLEKISEAIKRHTRPLPNPLPKGEGTPLLHDLRPILLDGVTGSGKTETYFHAIAAAITAGKQVLVLLPEIALTHQWLDRFEKTFGAKPCLWHSRMTPVAKARAWQAVACGEVPVVVGARSSLFLPFAKLGLIVVDEEHDPSYKQEDGVLYHARDMAVMRARFEQIPIVLVSATPSLETLENVREGKYRAAHLTERFGAAGLPTVKLVDMRLDAPERGDFLSPTVKHAMIDTLSRGEQVLFFLNRRGYAPLLLCRACGHRFQCADCSAWLVVHGRNRLECHHCGHKEPMPKGCPNCKAEADKLAPCGPGVERIMEEVRASFIVNGTSGWVPSPSGGRSGWGLDGQDTLHESHRKGHPQQKTLAHARELRKRMTDAEKKLWHQLRSKKLAIQFRRQHPIGNYIADFVAYQPRLIVELDGGQHTTLEAVAYDKARTEFLQAQGFTVLRFWNHEVMENIEGVMEHIQEAVRTINPHPDLPPEGEGTPPPVPSSSVQTSPRIALLSSDESITPETWAAIESGGIDILVGTQMVAKGHHFPRLTLVVVVDADVGLSGADLRAGERTYQMLHQLGGRAGRGELAGTVLVQTYAPEHPVMSALVAHDRDRLMTLEAKERKAGGWPPFGQLAAILLDGVDEAKVRNAGQMLARTAPVDARLTVLGPAPAPLSKLRGQYRYRLLVKAKPGIHLQRTLKAWLSAQKFSGVRIKIDVNPYYFM